MTMAGPQSHCHENVLLVTVSINVRCDDQIGNTIVIFYSVNMEHDLGTLQKFVKNINEENTFGEKSCISCIVKGCMRKTFVNT